MTKVSIIVPVYNSEKYLERCLLSLVNQTLKEIEIIAVNDASPDNSLEILIKFQMKYKQIKIINLNNNLRQGGARNRGLLASTGEFIGFVDADDWVDQTMYEELYLAAANTNSEIADADVVLYSRDGSIKNQVSIPIDLNGEIKHEEKKTLILKPGRLFTKIIKKDLFIKNSIYFPEKQSYDDNEVVPALVGSANRIVKVKKNLYFYFIDENSTSRGINNPLSFDRLIAAKNMVAHFVRLEIYSEFKPEIDYIFYQQYYANSIFVFLNKFDPPNKKYLFEIRSFMAQNYVDYRKNIYFKKHEKSIYKIYSLLNDISPSLLILINKILKFIMRILPQRLNRQIKNEKM